MRSFIFFSILYTCVVSALTSVAILFLAELSWGIATIVWLISAIVINTVHALVLQGIILPYLEREIFSTTEKFFYTLLPWMLVSFLLLILIQQPDPIILSVIAIQYSTASLSFYFYFSELKREKKEIAQPAGNDSVKSSPLETTNNL